MLPKLIATALLISSAALTGQIAPPPETLGVGCGGAAPSFATASTISLTADGARSVHTADVDGDGDLDVLSAASETLFFTVTDDEIAWFENTDGLGTFGAPQIISTSTNGARSVHAADVDGDGDNDVLCASQYDDTIAWYENTDGLGTFGAQQAISTSADGAHSVFAADVDGDGDVDVIAASPYDNTIAWLENTDGLGNFGAQQVISTNAASAHGVYAADIDGDGDIDVLSASRFDSKVAWYENTDGLGSFGAQQVITTSASGAHSVFAADVDGDGDLDVLSASDLDDKIAWYENTDGLGTFGADQVISASADGANSVHAADVDGDGDLDALSASSLDDKIAWYENTDGLGSFGAEQVISTGANNARSVYAADVDGDGILDVLSASQNDNKIAWYPNDATAPLTLIADTLQIGGSWSLQAENVQGIFAVFVFGDTAFDPGVPLDALGAPGCSGYTTGNLGAFVQLATNGTSAMSLPVPNNPALVGFELTAQSTCASSNALGFSTSNGLRATAGY
ncbi:MAG: VCBS repeat-containing protein [Planctomycetota bacterium]|nr:VCBS repeat-containing protein [Planctomycetota bacterium]